MLSKYLFVVVIVEQLLETMFGLTHLGFKKIIKYLLFLQAYE